MILNGLKRRHTKSLLALVRRVKAQKRLHRYVPTDEQFIASAALAILKQRRPR
jgi:hypothetical protein